MFIRRWNIFCTGSGIEAAQASFQLFQCTGPELGDSLLKDNPNAASEPLPDLIAAMRSLAVIPVATCVLHTELLQLYQERDEAFRCGQRHVPTVQCVSAVRMWTILTILSVTS